MADETDEFEDIDESQIHDEDHPEENQRNRF